MTNITVSLLKINVINANGRVYDNEAVNFIIDEFVKSEKGRAVGELIVHEHFPERLHFPERSAVISLSNVSHIVESIWLENDILKGSVKILKVEKGDQLKSLFEANKIVFRPRYIGTVSFNGVVKIKKLVAFDAIDADSDSFKNIL